MTITSTFTATRNLEKTNYICRSSFDPPDSPLITSVMLYLSCKFIYQKHHIAVLLFSLVIIKIFYSLEIIGISSRMLKRVTKIWQVLQNHLNIQVNFISKDNILKITAHKV